MTSPLSPRASYERIGRFVYAYHRAGAAWADQEALPPALAERAKRLTQHFEGIMHSNATASDADLAATLAEAGALQAAIAESGQA